MATSVSSIVTAALKAGSPDLRVSQGLRPATQLLPAIVFSVVTTDDDPDLETGAGGTLNARIQVDAWSTRPDEAEAIAAEAKALMLASNVFAAYPLGGFQDQEDDTRLYRVSRDFSIWFDE